MAISKAKVLEVKEHGSDIREYTLQLEKKYYFEAGSFLLLTLEMKDDYTRWPESRNFSIASSFKEDGTIRLIIRKVGLYTTRIFNELKKDSECVVKYAYGDFLLPFFNQSDPIYCIAGGTGIAPILSFCEQLKSQGMESRLHVYYSFKNSEEAPGIDLLKNVVPATQLHLFSTRELIVGIHNRRIEKLDLALTDFDNGYYYICGGEDFTHGFVEFLQSKHAPNVYSDEW
jgi:ferredoxin-NADP reductase